MKKEYRTIDEYIKKYLVNIHSIIQKISQAIRKVASEAIETISYQIPTFKLKNRNLIHFVVFKHYIGFNLNFQVLSYFRESYRYIKMERSLYASFS